jgi:DNA replication and repair protein RecF
MLLLMLKSLAVYDFRNYHEQKYTFSSSLIGFYGPNGKGKTNILEAISLLSVGKSWRTTTRSHLIQNNKDSALITAITSKAALECICTQTSRKFRINEKPAKIDVQKTGLATLLFAPEFIQLFSGTKSLRIRFFDRFLCQVSPQYKQWLKTANKILKQKQALLKSDFTTDLELQTWNTMLSQVVPQIADYRIQILKELMPFFVSHLQTISGISEATQWSLIHPVEYTNTEAGVQQWLSDNLFREKAAQRCLLGPHRDDFQLLYRDQPVSASASRGEERSLFLALLGAQKELLIQKLNCVPVLLLDDVFSELDASRQAHLEKLCEGTQAFFTTTHKNHFADWVRPAQLIEL